MNKTYIGDGVYAMFDGYQLWIWTEDGRRETSPRIALEPQTFDNLMLFYERSLKRPKVRENDPGRDAFERGNLGHPDNEMGM